MALCCVMGPTWPPKGLQLGGGGTRLSVFGLGGLLLGLGNSWRPLGAQEGFKARFQWILRGF
eukprot:8211849-Karenia_brevis.AAC.1